MSSKNYLRFRKGMNLFTCIHCMVRSCFLFLNNYLRVIILI